MYPIIEVFGRQIGMYGICATVGMIACAVVCILLGKKKGITYLDVILMMVAIIIGLLLGSHILYGITQYKTIIEIINGIGTKPIASLWALAIDAFGGSVFYGGLIGAMLGLLVETKINKSLNKGAAFDLFAVAIPLFHAFGRVGCFLAGCCYGIESEIGFVITGNTLNPAINGPRRFPVSLLEAFCNLILFVILLLMFRYAKTDGRLIFVYLIIYPVIRFCTEFLRGDEIRGIWGPFSTSQWISIALFIAGIIGLILTRKKKRS